MLDKTQIVGIYQSSPIKKRRNAIEVHLGTNSLLVLLVLFVCIVIANSRDVLEPNYLKGLSHEMLFFSGFLSVVVGIACYEFWNVGKRSIYSFHIMLTRALSSEMIALFSVRDYSFAIGNNGLYSQVELPSILRKLGCIAIIFLIVATTIDNRAYNKIKSIPDNLFQAKEDFCPEKSQDGLDKGAAEPGCELVVRAFQLGYTKDLGSCAPKKITPENLSVCDKRRADEPYLHYATRLLVDAGKKISKFLSPEQIQKVEEKFSLQWQQVEALRDYQLYAMSAAPRASHHIWTNLPAPNSEIQQAFIDVFQPNYCLDKFQQQTNTIALNMQEERSKAKLLEHVYGQLLFNPKVKRSVGLCKEYRVHWEADVNTCQTLADKPKLVLDDSKVLSEVELVLKRHDIAQLISELDDKIEKLEFDEAEKSEIDTLMESFGRKKDSAKKPIDKSKIAKNKRFREKHEVVSFQCFMRSPNAVKTAEEQFTFTLNGSEFPVRTYRYTASSSMGETQIAMYKDFAKVLETGFHYSQLSSRSDIEFKRSSVAEQSSQAQESLEVDQEIYLQSDTYLLARLEILNNIDIFLGNDWVLEREDLLEVYPFHVHLQNYVEKFRLEYQQNRGRL